MITVALPTWNNKNIIWLPMEGLARQKTTVDWELIVMECFSTNKVGEAYFREFYENRLKQAGCVNIKYIYSDRRMPLSAKWKYMYKQASGKHFLLQGSDDYPHPERIQQTWDNDADWFDIQRYWHYHIQSGKMLLFDSYMKDDAQGRRTYMAGECMAIRTELLANLPDYDVNRGVDHYILGNIGVKLRKTREGPYAGIATTGANTISRDRKIYFDKIEPPFYGTTATLDNIGLPDDVIERLKSYVTT